MAHPLAPLQPELQTLVWGFLGSKGQQKFRLVSSHSRAYADSRIKTVWVADGPVDRPEDRAPCPADVGAVVAFLRAFFERGGRPSALHLRLPEMAEHPSACQAYALAVLRALRDSGITSLRRLTLEGVAIVGSVIGAVGALVHRLEAIECLTGTTENDEGMAALVELAGPSLRRLVLAGDDDWEATLNAVMQSAHMLEELELFQQPLTRPLAAQLCHHPRLQRLVVNNVVMDADVVQGLEKLNVPMPLPPTLRHFGVVSRRLTPFSASCLDFPPCCVCVKLQGISQDHFAPDGTDPDVELKALKGVLAKLRDRTKGQDFMLYHFKLPPPGFASLMPDLGAMELRGLDLYCSVLTAEDLRAAAAHLATVEELTLSFDFPPSALSPLTGMRRLKCLRLDSSRASDDSVAAWADKAAVREALLGLLTGPAPLERLEVYQALSSSDRFLFNSAIDSATAWVREQLAAMGRDPAAMRDTSQWRRW